MENDIWDYIVEILRDRVRYYTKHDRNDIAMAYKTAIALVRLGMSNDEEWITQIDFFEER